jgi:hypothetical protein
MADQVQNHCIFCNGRGMTKEHFWPKWLTQYFPNDDDESEHWTAARAVSEYGDSLTHRNTNLKKRAGASTSHRVRRVCDKCNNGWMSRLQEEAKPVLLPLLTDRWKPISPKSQDIIARWAMMFTMVNEFRDVRTVAIRAEDRQKFMEKGRPLDQWAIFVGHYLRGIKHGACWHRSLGIQLAPKSGPVDETYTGQSTVLAFGSLLILAMSNSSRDWHLPTSAEMPSWLALSQIWPAASVPIQRPFRPLDDTDFDDVGRLLSEHVIRIGGFGSSTA